MRRALGAENQAPFVSFPRLLVLSQVGLTAFRDGRLQTSGDPL